MGNHPQMAELFSLVKYDDLPRLFIIIYDTGYMCFFFTGHICLILYDNNLYMEYGYVI